MPEVYRSDLTERVIGAAIEVHRELGPGLLEKAYQRALMIELDQTDLQVNTEVHLPVRYKNVDLNCNYRIDLWINKTLVIEVKAVESLNDVHKAQLLSYMKMSESKVGLLINFNVDLLKNGIRRIVL